MAYPLIEFNVGEKILANHQVFESDDPSVADFNQALGGMVYYEVVRCINGIPLFLEDHFDRLQASIQEPMDWNRKRLESEVSRIIKLNGIVNGNIRIVLTKTLQILYANKFYYPGKDEYLKGVCVGLLLWERKDPNIKAVREDYKNAISSKLKQKDASGPYFETLLYGNDGFVTEGSRSNVFFIKGNQVFTAPDADILKGITRKYVLESINKAGTELVVKKISVEEIKNFNDINSAFLSGTSIGVLPIRTIEEIQIDSSSDAVVMRIMKEYDNIVKNYLEEHKIAN